MIGHSLNKYHQGQEVWTIEDVFFYIGKNIECIVPFTYLSEFKLLETIGCVITGYGDISGNPTYSNEFIMFKNNELGRHIYDRFLSEKNITKILKEEHIEPSTFFPQYFMLHTDPDEKPLVVSKRK